MQSDADEKHQEERMTVMSNEYGHGLMIMLRMR